MSFLLKLIGLKGYHWQYAFHLFLTKCSRKKKKNTNNWLKSKESSLELSSSVAFWPSTVVAVRVFTASYSRPGKTRLPGVSLWQAYVSADSCDTFSSKHLTQHVASVRHTLEVARSMPQYCHNHIIIVPKNNGTKHCHALLFWIALKLEAQKIAVYL